jgi:hypothetical protein
MTNKEQATEIQKLYCKWCPKDCQNLTIEEKLGCLASGGFAEELKSLGYVQLDKDQSLPILPQYLGDIAMISEIERTSYKQAQQDMLNAGFKKVKK